jgi:ribosomal protein S18 acetylase RimI-like enzyme
MKRLGTRTASVRTVSSLYRLVAGRASDRFRRLGLGLPTRAVEYSFGTKQRKNGYMNTEFQKAILPKEVRGLMAFDHKVFKRADWFSAADWKSYESWWMIVNNTRVGCCAFEHNVDFHDDLREDETNPPLRGSLYISTTGILPHFRRMGFGTMLKAWQISYARYHGFTRIVTNTRKSNKSMIRINKQFGFKRLRTTPDYYDDPVEPTVVMELRFPNGQRAR